MPGGRVQKDETLTDAFERLTLAELGLQLPMAAGQFYGVWQHFYDDNFSGTGFSTHYIVLGFRLKVSEADLRLPDSQHDDFTAGRRQRRCWRATMCMTTAVPISSLNVSPGAGLMKILVYGINYSPELTGIGKYTGEMVEWMASQGHDVRVITAPPYYPEWKVGERYSSWRYRREEVQRPSGAARCMCLSSPRR